MVATVVALFGASFLASTVEMVEALTIILATGVTRGWRSTLIGAATASVALALVILIFGTALATVIPIEALRLFIGTILLIFGLQWLRKAILRASGLKALHDEEAIYAANLRELSSEAPAASEGMDWTGFTVAFKGVFLEGLEVAFIVVTFGGSAKDDLGADGLTYAALGALAAFLIVFTVGVLVHRPLATVPENSMKFVVGIMLAAFGTFWAAEGAGVEWELGDVTILLLLAVYTLAAWLAIVVLRRTSVKEAVAQ